MFGIETIQKINEEASLKTKVIGQRGIYEVFHKSLEEKKKYEKSLSCHKPYFSKVK